MLLFLTLLACSPQSETPTPPPAPPAPAPAKAEIDPRAKALFAALPARMDADGYPTGKAVEDLGRMLYYDTRLSKNHDISCNSCHQLDNYGVDSEPTSPGHKGARGDRNSPTSYNAALHLAQFWDGRAKDVEAQAKGPVLNPVEMAMASEEQVVSVLKSIPGYADAFKAAFPDQADPITYDNMANAIGAFERGLVTPGPLDAYLGGDMDAMTDAQLAGMTTFLDVGCAGCHMGAAVGGTSYQKLGVVKPWEGEDVGLAKVSGDEADNQKFKVPSLRNITETGPYLHDGSISSLDVMVQRMATHQLGKELSEQETKSIVAFFGALKGTPDAAYIAKPELPASGPETPAPDPS